METRYNANANRYVDSSTGRFIAFETQAKIQLRLDRIQRAVDKARAGSLYAVGYLISTIAKGKISRSRDRSPPGQPPATRRGLLRRAIRYAVSDDKRSVVVGPTHQMVGTAGKAHEFGGRYKRQRYPKRPFMGPALQEALPKIGPTYKVR